MPSPHHDEPAHSEHPDDYVQRSDLMSVDCICCVQKLNVFSSWLLEYCYSYLSGVFQRIALISQAVVKLLPDKRCLPFGFVPPACEPQSFVPYAPHWGRSVPDCGPLNMRLDPCLLLQLIWMFSGNHA